jgi:hypothetical protein
LGYRKFAVGFKKLKDLLGAPGASELAARIVLGLKN